MIGSIGSCSVVVVVVVVYEVVVCGNSIDSSVVAGVIVVGYTF